MELIMAYSTIPLMESPDEESLQKDLEDQRAKLEIKPDPQVKENSASLNSKYLEESDKVILWTGSELKAVSREKDGSFIKDLRFGNKIASLESEVSLNCDT